MKDPRITPTTDKVLQAFCADTDKEVSGIEIIRLFDLFPGTVYPILRRLKNAGWLDSRWEDVDPVTGGKPRQQFYRITPYGLERLATKQGGRMSPKPLILFLDPRLKHELKAYADFNKAFRDDGWAIVATRGLDGTEMQRREDGYLIRHGEWSFWAPMHMILFGKSHVSAVRNSK